MPTPPDWVLAEMPDGPRLGRRIKAFRESGEFHHLVQGDDSFSGALAAINIGRELRSEYPSVRFSVTRPRHGAIRIAWKNGPSITEVAGLTGKYAASRVIVTSPGRIPRLTVWLGVFGGADSIILARPRSAAGEYND